MGIFSDIRTVLLFIVVFTVIIAVHEFGHYLTARLLGMRVLEFAFGFPPRLAGIKHASIDYTLNWIPFGGFVRILGQDDFSIKQQGEGDPQAFTSKPWWAQAIVLVAGVAMNFVLAIVVLTAAFALGTTGSTGEVRVLDVSPSSPAQAAGFQPGDIVVSVDGRKVDNTRALISYTRSKAEHEIFLEVTRNGRPLPTIVAIPRSEPPEGQGPLGIKIEEVQGPKTVALPEAFGEATALTGEVVQQIAELPGQLIGGRTGGPAAPEVTGPIGIIQITGQVAELGLPTILKLVGVLSVNLGVLNIVPFPGLDGGRLLFVLIAGIFKKQFSPQVEAAIHAVGFLLLLGLLVVVSISDIRRVVGG